MNNHSKEIRSYNMSQIKSKNSKPEESATKYLFSKGFRYRKNVDTLPGSPDIVFAKYKTVVFVNGCFWHMHEGYWTKKLMRNKARDEENKEALEKLGWKY
jgi:DNA mismatch endonuclease (patch repair protein)